LSFDTVSKGWFERYSHRMNRPRAAIYCNVGRRATDPGSAAVIDRQEAACREFAESIGWEPVEVYTDAGLPGPARLGYASMINAIKAGEIGGVISYEMPTISRRAQEVDALLELLQERGIALRTVTDGIDTSTFSGRYAARIAAETAQFESTRQDTRQAHREQA
jgi:site-specific DNA recombinase